MFACMQMIFTDLAQSNGTDAYVHDSLFARLAMLPVKGNVPQKSNRLCPGARRSFFCRMKCKLTPSVKGEPEVVQDCQHHKTINSGKT